MKKINILFLFSFLALAISSCQKEDDKFEGTDNYITSFSLKKGETSYKARINGDQIMLTVSGDEDLTGAVAQYEICENAKIAPDPATITDWNERHQFAVTSYNKQSRTYTFVVTKTDISLSGMVVLKTQADVDLFGQKNISDLDGDLIIGESAAYKDLDTIKNINALSSLTKVRGNIVINPSFGGKELDGLKNLTQAGNIYIGSTTSSASLIDSLDITLPALQSVGEIVINAPKAKTIAMDKLESALNVFIDGKSLSSISFGSLHKVLGNLTLQSGKNASTSTANAQLQNFSLPILESVGGSLVVQGLIATEQIKLPTLKTVGALFTISYLSKLADLDISSLECVGGKMTFSNLNLYTKVSAPKLKNAGGLAYAGEYSSRPVALFALPALESISGDFTIEYVNSEELVLPNLESISGQLKINYTEQLTNLSIPKLAVCPNISLSSIYKLENLDFSGIGELKSLSVVSGYILSQIKLPATLEALTLNGGSTATAIPVLAGLEKITGTFNLSNYKAPTISIGGVKYIGSYSMSVSNLNTLSFPDLEEIGIFKLSDYNMTSLGAPKLKKAASIDWSNFWLLTSIDLSSLSEVTGELKLWGASYAGSASKCQMTNIDFLSNLNKVGSVNIKWWSALTDFIGLKNAISSITGDKWAVEACGYNPTYQNMVDGEYVKPESK